MREATEEAGPGGCAQVAHSADGQEQLSARETARRFGLNEHILAAACKEKRVRGSMVVKGGRVLRYLFDPDEVAEDIEKLPCEYPGCDRPALGPSGGCEAHAGAVLTSGKLRPPEIRVRIADGTRRWHHEQGRGVREERWCQWCGEYLGFVLTSHNQRFHSISCARYWEHENKPEWFPHAHGPGPLEFLCAICRHRTVERWPSEIEAAGGPKKCRFICPVCDPLWRSAVMRIRQLLRDGGNHRAVSLNGAKESFKVAAAIAATFEHDIRASSKKKPGRRHPLTVDLLIEAAHRAAFTDRLVTVALNWLVDEEELHIPGLKNRIDVEYVEQRRSRTKVWRRARRA